MWMLSSQRSHFFLPQAQPVFYPRPGDRRYMWLDELAAETSAGRRDREGPVRLEEDRTCFFAT